MRIYARSELRWRKNKLCLGSRTKALMEVQRYSAFEEYPECYQVKWPDGVLSEDFYNLSRAKDHAVRIALGKLNGGSDLEDPRKASPELLD